MADAKNMKLIAVNLEKEKARELRIAAASEEKNMTQFIREAIDEKMGKMPTDDRASFLEGCFDRADEDGKAWLIQCAGYAAGRVYDPDAADTDADEDGEE